MISLERIMVALDLSTMDEHVIKYLANRVKSIKPAKIYFFNAQKSLELPPALKEEYPELVVPGDEEARAIMKAEVKRYFPEVEQYDVEYKVVEGSARREIIRWTNHKNINLLILGLKPANEGSGLLTVQVARNVPCSLLLVPKNPPKQTQKIWVASDFSDYGKLAWDTGASVAAATPGTELVLHHVYEVPSGYSKIGKTQEEFSNIMRIHAQKQFLEEQKRIESLNVPSSAVFTWNRSEASISKLVNDVAKENEADLIVVGTRGVRGLQAFFLGSVAAKLVQYCHEIPILLVRDPDTSFNLIDFIDSL
ncbi:universal stress protein [Pontibacter sp. G13]|uniref:universal stress protein n=1 Tax=Pontibacter sp. G13 TaxID=3074898 RepID=UPI00288ABDCA|nr:universal stress protein [Pontibacter sp. G13]WNJ17776.1 universal stress protein [Pontibacter sp. G13]